MIRRIIFALLVAGIAGAAMPSDSLAQSELGAAALGRFVGTWDGTGTFLDGPYSKAGSADAKTTCAWSNDRLFMICQQSVVMQGKPSSDVAVYAYDPGAKRYHFYNIGLTNANATKLSIEGNTVTYADSFQDGGKTIATRTLNVWRDPQHYQWRSEYSTDGGATWKLMGSGNATRTS
jgi:hypothetical protein